MRRFMISLFLLMIFLGTSTAQNAPVKFEAVSIKANISQINQVAIQTPPGRFRAIAVSVKLLIQTAYGVKDPEIIGGPAWITSDRFDIEATRPDATPEQSQITTLLQALLADRFQLKTHHETRDLDVFELSVAKGGPKLETAVEQSPDHPASSKPGSPPMPRPGGFTQGFGQMAGSAVRMGTIVQALSQQLRRPVIDKTGLVELYNFRLVWTPDLVKNQVAPGTAPFVVNGQTIDPDGPSLVTAVQEQLGLKLDAAKSAVEVIVIDKVERPSEN